MLFKQDKAKEIKNMKSEFHSCISDNPEGIYKKYICTKRKEKKKKILLAFFSNLLYLSEE